MKTQPRFGVYEHLRTATQGPDKLTGTITLGMSYPTQKWEGPHPQPPLELRTFWDADRQTLVTQVLQMAGHQTVLGERYLDAHGELKQTLNADLPKTTQLRLTQDMQLQERKHYLLTNRFGFLEPLKRWFKGSRRQCNNLQG
jgi:hypothetical protein